MSKLFAMAKARIRMMEKIGFDEKQSILLGLNSLNIPCDEVKQEIIGENEQLPQPRSEISIDLRYLFGLLTGLFQWNNAQVGSQFQTRRIPDEFLRDAQKFLNFLTV
jgi:hypothetical protein